MVSAFQTPTGMPYGTVNLLRGVSPTETPVTCTAGVGTFILEFATLSRLTGDATFENVARQALRALWKTRSDIGLVTSKLMSLHPFIFTTYGLNLLKYQLGDSTQFNIILTFNIYFKFYINIKKI